MALTHKFAIVEKKNMKDVYIIDKKMRCAEISDCVIRYLNDSLLWFTSSWNGEKKAGLPYYGIAIIEKEDIKKFINIVECWYALFSFAPEIIELTGDFLIDENIYEKKKIPKIQAQKELEELIDVCKNALMQDRVVLYNGI